MTTYNARELIRIAERAGLPVRQCKGSHVAVTLPNGRRVMFASHGSTRDGRKLHVQVKAFQEAGLL